MKKFISLIAALVAMTSAMNARADLITFAFEGEVTTVDSAVAGSFSAGDRFYLNYTFESAMAGTGGIGDSSYDAITSLSLTAGSFSASATGGTIRVFDGSEDGYLVDTSLAQGLTAPVVASLTLTSFRLVLVDNYFPPIPGGAFTDSSLPSALDLTPFIDNLGDPLNCITDCAFFRLTFEELIGGASPAIVAGVVTAAAAPIPEPGTLTLFGIGLAGMGLARRRKTA